VPMLRSGVLVDAVLGCVAIMPPAES
jgi:hypothetical protein